MRLSGPQSPALVVHTKWEGERALRGRGQWGSGSWLSVPCPQDTLTSVTGHGHAEGPLLFWVPETQELASRVPCRASLLSPIPPLAKGQH